MAPAFRARKPSRPTGHNNKTPSSSGLRARTMPSVLLRPRMRANPGDPSAMTLPSQSTCRKTVTQATRRVQPFPQSCDTNPMRKGERVIGRAILTAGLLAAAASISCLAQADHLVSQGRADRSYVDNALERELAAARNADPGCLAYIILKPKRTARREHPAPEFVCMVHTASPSSWSMPSSSAILDTDTKPRIE